MKLQFLCYVTFWNFFQGPESDSDSDLAAAGAAAAATHETTVKTVATTGPNTRPPNFSTHGIQR